jgi:hypothetical protein
MLRVFNCGIGMVVIVAERCRGAGELCATAKTVWHRATRARPAGNRRSSFDADTCSRRDHFDRHLDLGRGSNMRRSSRHGRRSTSRR